MGKKLNVFAAIWHLYKNLQELRFVAQNTKPKKSPKVTRCQSLKNNSLFTVNVSTLISHLSRFYCKARHRGKLDDDDDDDEMLYHKNSLINIRAAINHPLAEM